MKKQIYLPISDEAIGQYWQPEQLADLHRTFCVETPSPGDPWSEIPTGASGVICGWGATPMPEIAWRDLPELQIVAIYGGSPQAIEGAAELIESGVCVTNASVEMAEGVAEETVALLLCSQLDIVNSALRFRESLDRRYTDRLSRSLSESTIGIVGFGFIARHVVRMLRGFRPKFLVYDPYVDHAAVTAEGCTPTSLEDLFGRSDAVTVHAGLTAETKGMISARLLDTLPDHALVVSTARTPIFDEPALAERVASGRVRFASDFIPFEESVWRPMHGSEHLIGVHGHTSVTTRTVRRMAERVILDLRAVLTGEGTIGHELRPEWMQHTT